MTGARPATPTDPPGPRGPRVWVCVFHHGDGTEVWVCDTEAIAHRELARACRTWWRDARRVDRRRCHDEENPPLPLRPPASDRTAVDLYFAAMRSAIPAESFSIACHRPIGAGRELGGQGHRPGGEAVAHHEPARHVGHRIVCVAYAGGADVAIECEDCAEVIYDRDRPVGLEVTPGTGDDLRPGGRPLPILARLRRAPDRGSPAERAGRDQEV
jgi:hypothetical protein